MKHPHVLAIRYVQKLLQMCQNSFKGIVRFFFLAKKTSAQLFSQGRLLETLCEISIPAYRRCVADGEKYDRTVRESSAKANFNIVEILDN